MPASLGHCANLSEVSPMSISCTYARLKVDNPTCTFDVSTRKSNINFDRPFPWHSIERNWLFS